jgi:hypothetical protein
MTDLRIDRPVLTEDGRLQVFVAYENTLTMSPEEARAKNVRTKDLVWKKALVVSVLMRIESSLDSRTSVHHWRPLYTQFDGSLTRKKREEIAEGVISLIAMANDGRPICRRYRK